MRWTTESIAKLLQVKLVLQRNRLFVESPDKEILETLLEHPDIAAAHEAAGGGGIRAGTGRRDTAAQRMATDMERIDLANAQAQADAAAAVAAADDADAGAAEAAEAEREAAAVAGGSMAGAARGVASAAGAAASGATGAGAAVAAVAQAGSASAGGTKQPAELRMGGGGTEDAEVRPCGHQHIVPYAEASAIAPEADMDEQIFSFEIAAAHVRSRAVATISPARF